MQGCPALHLVVQELSCRVDRPREWPERDRVQTSGRTEVRQRRLSLFCCFQVLLCSGMPLARFRGGKTEPGVLSGETLKLLLLWG